MCSETHNRNNQSKFLAFSCTLQRFFIRAQELNNRFSAFNISRLAHFYSLQIKMQIQSEIGQRQAKLVYLSPMRAAKVQASLRIRAVSPEPPLLAHTSSESRGTFRQKARSLAHLNGWACAVEIYHDGMLEDTNSLDGAQLEIQPFTHSELHQTHCLVAGISN